MLGSLRPRRLLRRHRRALAAALAALSVLAALGAIRAPAAPAVAATPVDPTALHAGEAGVPILLSSASRTDALVVGDVVDLVAVDDGGVAHVVCTGARILAVPPASSVIGGSSAAAILVAVPSGDALDVTAATAATGLSVIHRPL